MPITEYPSFKSIEKEDKIVFDYFFRKYPPTISEFNFTTLFCWRNAKNHEFTIIEGHMLVSCRGADNKRRFYQPVGKNPVRIIKKVLTEFPSSSFEKVEARHALQLKTHFAIEHERDMDDYLYRSEDLIELKGQKYAAKRNFIKRFIEYKPNVTMLNEKNISQCLELEAAWYNDRKQSQAASSVYEDIALREALQNFKKLGLFGIVVGVNGRAEGFAVGEPLNKDTFAEHFEKANTKFTGIYQYLLHEFVNNMPKQFEFINREQDLGIEGLRKAKMSYNPFRIIKKYKVMKK